MNPLAWLAGSAGTGLLKAGGEIVRTVAGDASAREAQASAEQIALMQQFASEFALRNERTAWDSFVDGLNRLPRPLMTFGMIGLLAWACVDPVNFAFVMQALSLVPEPLWAVWGGMVAFWFGSRELAKLRAYKVDAKALRAATDLVAAREDRAADLAETTVTATAKVAASRASSPLSTAVGNAVRAVTDKFKPVRDNGADDLCALAATLWGEARGETRAGKVAVAWVIRNRVAEPAWWGKGWTGVCLAKSQFTCWWDRQAEAVRTVDESDPKFAECLAIAREVMAGNLSDPTNGATHYYADSMSQPPKWARGKTPCAVIGHHRFYKLGPQG